MGHSLDLEGIAARVAGAGRVVSPGGAASYRLPGAPAARSGRDRCGGGGFCDVRAVGTGGMVAERRRRSKRGARRPRARLAGGTGWG